MQFQIFKLFVARWLAALVIWCQDFYIDNANKISCAMTYFSVFIIKWIMSHPNYRLSKNYIMGAMLHSSATNYTLAVRYYYATDKYLTVSSLYRWLSKFGNLPSTLNIIFMRGNELRAAQINLDDETEKLTNAEIPDGDISLENLPSKLLLECAINWEERKELLEKMLKQIEADCALGKEFNFGGVRSHKKYAKQHIQTELNTHLMPKDDV